MQQEQYGQRNQGRKRKSSSCSGCKNGRTRLFCVQGVSEAKRYCGALRGFARPRCQDARMPRTFEMGNDPKNAPAFAPSG